MAMKNPNLYIGKSLAPRLWLSLPDVVKAEGGEGSRGGKVIGHTSSGQPIYATSSVRSPDGKHGIEEYSGWQSDVHTETGSHLTPKDHKEIADFHQTKASQHSQALGYDKRDGRAKTESSDERAKHRHFRDQHEFAANYHTKEAERKQATAAPKNTKQLNLFGKSLCPLYLKVKG
jgi:hypothetical protein